MNGVNIGTFDSSVPQVTESAGLGYARIDSTKSTLQQVIDDEHVFPAAGGSAVGYHRLGSARAYSGTQSRVSSTGTDGRFMVTSDTSRLFGVGSGATIFYGGSQVLSVDSNADTAGGRHHWVDSFGTISVPAIGVSVTLPNSGYSGVPYVLVTNIGPDASSLGMGVPRAHTLTATNFQIIVQRPTDGAGVAGEVTWMSRGTRVL